MGAWGYGHFEDDLALDFMADVEDSDNPKEVITDALDSAIAADYMESDEGNAAIVAAAYVDAQLNGTKYSASDQVDPLDVDTIGERLPDLDLSGLRKKAILALNKVLADKSELKELWEENEGDYPLWRKGIEQLIERLSN
jgi:hypothetical protein